MTLFVRQRVNMLDKLPISQNNPMCSAGEEQTGLSETTLTQSRIVAISKFRMKYTDQLRNENCSNKNLENYARNYNVRLSL